MPIQATVNCDMGEGYSLYSIGDDEGLMKTIHLANIACGFHASDFSIMDQTVALAKQYKVAVGAHPSLPDRQGFGRREMKMDPTELSQCFIYQLGALAGFLKKHDLDMNHLKPHGAIYGQTARNMDLALAAVGVAKLFGASFMGLAGTCHQKAAEELNVRFIAEWFADLDYDPSGKLLITKKHATVPLEEVKSRVKRILNEQLVTTTSGTLPLGNVSELSVCVHSDTPGSVEIAQAVKILVDENNAQLAKESFLKPNPFSFSQKS